MRTFGGNYYRKGTTKSIDDVTGAREYMTDQFRRWDGFYTIRAAHHPRQPQDFSAKIQPQTIVANARPAFEFESDPPTFPII